MTRSVFRFAASFGIALLISSTAFAQAAKPATPAQTTTPPAKAKWVPPIKGVATIDVIRGESKRVGTDIVTTLRIKNTSSGAIALLQVDEYWYDKNRNIVSGDTQKVKQLMLPGDIVEVKTKSPSKPDLYTNQFKFSHANGAIKANAVKKFE